MERISKKNNEIYSVKLETKMMKESVWQKIIDISHTVKVYED